VGKKSDTRSRRAWELAAEQHGIVTRKQLLALGFSSKAIEHRVDRARLFPVSLGVYAVGWPALDQKRRWMAAVLAGGEGAVLSHRSAATLWEIGDGEKGRIDVSVRRRCELRRPGICFHVAQLFERRTSCAATTSPPPHPARRLSIWLENSTRFRSSER
jgi:hypothetical protein